MPSGRAPREGGFTLIETLITIIVIAIAVVAVTSAFAASIIGSDVHRQYSRAEEITRDNAEAIKTKAAVASSYPTCPQLVDLTPTFTYPTGEAGQWVSTVSNLQYWIPDPANFPNGTWTSNRAACSAYYTACASDIPACDPGLQRVTLTVTSVRTGRAAIQQTSRVVTRRHYREP